MTRFILWFRINRPFPGLIETGVARIRSIDDRLSACLKEGVDQVVVLGAGYDARAYRFEALKDKKVFEVDHPGTQAMKKEKILTVFGSWPEHVVFVPVDFEKDDLPGSLNRAGYRKELKTVFIWEAVSKYLTSRAASRLLTLVAENASPGSSIVFDYVYESIIDGSAGLSCNKKMLRYLEKKGEPFIFGLPENNPEQFLLNHGYSKATNFPAHQIKETYFGNGPRSKHFHLFWGVMHAVV